MRIEPARVLSLKAANWSEPRAPAWLWLIRRLSPLIVAILIFQVPPAWGECVRTSILGETQVYTGHSLGKASTDGEDLEITVETAHLIDGTLSLIDSDDRVVKLERVFVEPQTTVRLRMMDALREVPERGFQFSLRLEHVSEEGSSVLAELPLRFNLDCPLGEPCSIAVREGVSTQGPMVPQELIDALDEVREPRAAETVDLLGLILGRYPKLRGAVYELAFQWDDRSDAPIVAQSQGKSRRCACRWVPSLTTSSPQPLIRELSPGATELKSKWARGPRGFVAGQTIDGKIEKAIASHATLGMSLVCSRRMGATPTTIEILDRALQPLMIPVITSCEAPCQGTIRHSTRVQLCTEARVFAGQTQTASADLDLDATFRLNGATVFSASAETHLFSGSSMALGQDSDSKKQDSAILGNRSAGTIALSGGFAAEAARTSRLDGSYAFAAMSSDFSMVVEGRASCADFTKVHAAMGVQKSGGGIVLERWGDPP